MCFSVKVYSHSHSQRMLQFTALPEGPQSLVVFTQSIKNLNRPITLLHYCFTSKTSIAQIHPHIVQHLVFFSHTTPSFRCASLPHSIPSPLCSHSYPLMLNFAVKSLQTARAQRQMFPIEMRIDFPNGPRDQRFVLFHFNKTWWGASLQ